jgi:flagella basal body P-ring formation protein FlgA
MCIRDSIEIPPLVKRGEAVTMTARKGGILVTARGTAQQDGIEGAQIKVRNSSSQKEILCRVRAPGQVEVEF